MSFISGFFGGWTAILLAIPVGLVAAFVAMNPAGFIALLASAGGFIVIAFLKLVEGGVAALMYAGQMLLVTIANVFIAIINAVIGALNLVAQAIVNFIMNIPGLNIAAAILAGAPPPPPIPYIQYIQPPSIPPSLKNLVAEIGQGLNQVNVAAQMYVADVQANAPGSYVTGAAAGTLAGGATYFTRSGSGYKYRGRRRGRHPPGDVEPGILPPPKKYDGKPPKPKPPKKPESKPKPPSKPKQRKKKGGGGGKKPPKHLPV